MNELTILCDVDGVVADLHTEWLRRYNEDFDDDLDLEGIGGWSFDEYVKPECGKRIYDYLHDTKLYDRVDPLPGAVNGVKALRARGHRVVFVTSCVDGTADDKVEWLRRHGLLDHGYSPGEDFIAASDKGLVNGDVLLDDAPHNLDATDSYPVCWDAPYNRGRGSWVRVHGWEDFLGLVDVLASVPQKGVAYDLSDPGPYATKEALGGEVRTKSLTGGEKGSKPARFDLIPTRPLWELAVHYGVGAMKYEDRNWERGYPWSLSYAALQRHANQFWSGEDIDPENGRPHLAAVAFHAFALMEWAETHPEYDDRPSVERDAA